MSTELPSKPSLNSLQDTLQEAAHNFAAAYVEELEQYQVTGIQPPPAVTIPLGELQKKIVYQGMLEAVMPSALVRGNQSKAASLVFGFNRATLRKLLKLTGLIAPRRQLSQRELDNRAAKRLKNNEAA